MNKKLLCLSGASVMLGVILLHLHVRRLELRAQGGRRVPVVFVTRDVPAGAALAAGGLQVRELPEAYVESRHVRRDALDKVIGQRTVGPLRAGETLLWTDLGALGASTRTLATLVREGLRAITVDTQTDAFAGLLQPGDRVDVLALPRGQAGKPGASARTVVEGALVLAVGQDLGSVVDDERARGQRRASGVTLSVTAEQAARIAEAEVAERLRLVLRNPDDTGGSHAG